MCTHPTGLVCPPLTSIPPACVIECTGDIDCTDGEYCCETGCGGAVCVPPIQRNSFCSVSMYACTIIVIQCYAYSWFNALHHLTVLVMLMWLGAVWDVVSLYNSLFIK